MTMKKSVPTKCFMNLCSNPPKFLPRVRFTAVKSGAEMLYPWSTMDVPLCKDHRHTLDLSTLFPPKQWSAVCAAYKKADRPVPVWEKTKLVFERIRR